MSATLDGFRGQNWCQWLILFRQLQFIVNSQLKGSFLKLIENSSGILFPKIKSK